MTMQERILLAIADFQAREAMPPTLREIGAAVELLSTGHVAHHITALAGKGLIRRRERIARGVWLTAAGVARVAALRDAETTERGVAA